MTTTPALGIGAPSAAALRIAALEAELKAARLTIADLTDVVKVAEEYHWTHYCDGIGAKSDAEIRADLDTVMDTYRRSLGIRDLPPAEDEAR